MHRWDAEHAVGTASPVEEQLAADGIDEFLTVLAPYRFASEDGIDLGGSLHLHCTDVDGEWTIHTDDGVYRIDRGHAKGDVAVRGPASQLLLVVFQRLGPDADERRGLRRPRDPRPLARPRHALRSAGPGKSSSGATGAKAPREAPATRRSRARRTEGLTSAGPPGRHRRADERDHQYVTSWPPPSHSMRWPVT